jgi:ABC-2 type transport system ATP-binding protein
MIEVHDLVKRYKGAETNAVDGVSFSVAPGQFFALLGPNGAGKTTTISILTTTLEPTSGQATIAGHDIVRDSGAVRREIGIIFQKPSLDMNLTAEENVRLHAILYGLSPFRPTFGLMPRAYKEQIQELAVLVGIQEEIFKPIKTFSGGMKRKLEIVRTLMHRPRVLFLDEPTTGLDPASRRNLWGYLRQVQAESGTTILLTTHYLDEAEDVDCVCIINKGRIVSYGTPAQVKADLIEAYLLLDAVDRPRLRAELSARGLRFAETPLFKVDLNGHNIHQLLKAIETPLTVVQTHVPTLEDAYLEIVGRAETDGN